MACRGSQRVSEGPTRVVCSRDDGCTPMRARRNSGTRDIIFCALSAAASVVLSSHSSVFSSSGRILIGMLSGCGFKEVDMITVSGMGCRVDEGERWITPWGREASPARGRCSWETTEVAVWRMLCVRVAMRTTGSPARGERGRASRGGAEGGGDMRVLRAQGEWRGRLRDHSA